jgi:tetratricopeptide (TPR) repeat protein
MNRMTPPRRAFQLFAQTALALLVTIAAFSTLAAQTPDPAAAEKYNQGLAFLKTKDYEKALNVFLDAEKLANKAGDKSTASKSESYAYRLCYNVGLGYHKAKDDAKALEFFEKGIAMEPAYYKNYLGKATILKEKGDEAGAIEAFIKTGEVASAAGELEERTNARAQAEYLVSKGIKKDDYASVIKNGEIFLQYLETADIHYYMAVAYNHLGKYQEALDHATKALSLETGSRTQKAKIYFEQAEAYKNLSKFQLAVQSYQEAAYGEFKQRAEHEIEVLAGSE